MNTAQSKYFLYARKSTDVEDKQVRSIEDQLAELRDLAKKEEICIVDELIEKQSAKVPGRPIFNSMVNRIEQGEADGIISWHPDRLARNSVDGGRIVYLLDTGKLAALKFNTFWFESTPQGKFMLSIAFSQSKYYVDSLSENTARGLRQKVKRGDWPGIAPHGYFNDKASKTIKVDQSEAKIIKKAFLMYSENKYPLQKIADFLAQHGIKSRNGFTLHKDRVKYLLSNPFYYGHFRFKREIFAGRHEPIVTKKLFDQVQRVLNDRSRPQKPSKTPQALTNFIRCGECDMMVTAEVQKGHVYYRCTKKSKSHHCQQGYIREEVLSDQLTNMVKQFSLKEDWADWMLNKLKKEETDSAQSFSSLVASNQMEKFSIDQKLQFLLDSYLDQVIDRSTYLIRKDKLMSDKKTLEEKITALQQHRHNWLEPMREWIKDAADTPKIITGQNLPAQKTHAVKIFGSNLKLTDQKLLGEALNPWAALRAAPTSRNVVPEAGVEPA